MAERKVFDKFFPTYDHDCFYTRWEDVETGQSDDEKMRDAPEQQMANVKQHDQTLLQDRELQERVLAWQDRVQVDILRPSRSERINQHLTQVISTSGSVIPETTALSDETADKEMTSMRRNNRSLCLKDPASKQPGDKKGMA